MDYISKRGKTKFYHLIIKNIKNIKSENLEELKIIRDTILNQIEIKPNPFIKKFRSGYYINLEKDPKKFHFRNKKNEKIAFLRAEKYLEKITNPENFDLNKFI